MEPTPYWEASPTEYIQRDVLIVLLEETAVLDENRFLISPSHHRVLDLGASGLCSKWIVG